MENLSYRVRVARVISARPEALCLLVWQIGFVVLALATFYDVSLIFVVICFSTWIVLPWAFLENVKCRDDQLKLLKRGQAFLFMGGFFFVLYILLRIVSGIPSTGPVILPNQELIKSVTYFSAFILMSLGLYYSGRVVNFVTGLGKRSNDLFYIVFFPLFLFNYGILLVQILGIWLSGIILYSHTETTYFILLFVFAILMIYPMFKTRSIIKLADRFNIEGLLAFIVLITPIVLLAIAFSGVLQVLGSVW